jgi:anaphase-promoting complex subunit 2
LTESAGAKSDDPLFTIVDSMADLNKNGLASEGCQLMEEEAERSVASVEEQLKKEMTVFEV